MKGINYRILMNNWDAVVDKICDEMTPHDVLRVIADYIQRNIKESKKHKLNCDKLEKGHELIIEAMNQLNPEEDMC